MIKRLISTAVVAMVLSTSPVTADRWGTDPADDGITAREFRQAARARIVEIRGELDTLKTIDPRTPEVRSELRALRAVRRQLRILSKRANQTPEEILLGLAFYYQLVISRS